MDRRVAIAAIVVFVIAIVILGMIAVILRFVPGMLPQTDVAVGIAISDPEIRDYIILRNGKTQDVNVGIGIY